MRCANEITDYIAMGEFHMCFPPARQTTVLQEIQTTKQTRPCGHCSLHFGEGGGGGGAGVHGRVAESVQAWAADKVESGKSENNRALIDISSEVALDVLAKLLPLKTVESFGSSPQSYTPKP